MTQVGLIPDSDKLFPDGARYRLEFSGVETPLVGKAIIDEASKNGLPVHRLIATVGGSKYWTNQNLKELAKIAHENKVEVIICPWILARGLIDNPNNMFTNMNPKNSDEFSVYWMEVLRCIHLGFRGFLAWTPAMAERIADARNCGLFPPETIFKVSTFANCRNPKDFLLYESLGANTINSANGLTVKELSDVRQTLRATLDTHITFWQMALRKQKVGDDLFVLILEVNPYDRVADAPEIARVASPVYFKFEAGNPGIGVYDLSGPNWTEDDLIEHKREDVRTAAKVVEDIKRKYPHLKLSDWGPADLRVPIV
jgi:hypothetical protein